MKTLILFKARVKKVTMRKKQTKTKHKKGLAQEMFLKVNIKI